MRQIIDLPNVVNFLKNLDLPEEELNKIFFIYHYKISSKKQLKYSKFFEKSKSYSREPK